MRNSKKVGVVWGVAWTLVAAGLVASESETARVPVLPKEPASTPRAVTLPFALDHNRMIVEVELLRPDGTVRTVRAWVDTGNPYLVLGEELARDLGLEVAPPKAAGEREGRAWATRTPSLRLGGLPLPVDGIETQILLGARSLPGVPSEVNLPASALRSFHVVFDYPKRELTVARPGGSKPRGVAVPCRVNPRTGLFQIEAIVDGEPLQLGVDNGASSTWLSETVATAWATRHPEWPRARGAVGTTNFFGFGFEAGGALMRLPELRIGPLSARDVGVLALPQGLFDWYSTKSAAPLAGFLGANVLRGFRLEIDYPSQMTYWEAGPSPDPADLDLVGLTLRPEKNGSFTVAGVAAKGDEPAVEGVQVGDRLLRVGALETTGATMGEVVNALRGNPGDTRTLVLEREGKEIVVDAKVLRFP